MPAPTYNVPTTGTDPKIVTLESHESAIQTVVDELYSYTEDVEASVDTAIDALSDTSLGTLTQGQTDLGASTVSLNYVSGGVTRNDDHTVTLPVGGDCWFDTSLALDQIGATSIDVLFRVLEGTVDNLALEQRNSAGSLLNTESDPVEEVNGLYVAREILLNGSTAYMRVRIKNMSGSVDAKITAPEISISGRLIASCGQSSNLSAASLLAANEQLGAPNIYVEPSGISAAAGTGATLSGRTVTVEAESLGLMNVYPSDTITASDTVTIVLRADGPFKFVQASPDTGLSVGGNDQIIDFKHLGNGWFIGTFSGAAAGGADPAYIEFRFDCRSNKGYVSSGPRTFSSIWLAKNFTGVPAFVNAPVVVSEALKEAGVSVAVIDSEAGDDANTGSFASPVLTVAKAVSLGASKIYLRKRQTPYRHTGIAFSGVTEVLGFAGAGDTAEHAKLWASKNLVADDFIVTSADASVYFHATDQDPEAVWENVGNKIARFGENRPDGVGGVRADYNQASADEATVRGAAGRWWFGTGSEGVGIYLRPTEDTLLGKSYEISTSDIGVTFAAATCQIKGVYIGFGRKSFVQTNYSQVESHNCIFAHSGTNDGVDINELVQWIDHGNCIFMDAGDDGVDMRGDGATFISLGGSKFIENIGDGVAPHDDRQTVKIYHGELSRNGKQGLVTIGTGEFVIQGCTLRDNASVDMLVRLGALTTATTVELHSNVAGTTEVTADDPSVITGSITNHTGPLVIKADLSVLGHRSIGAVRALDVEGGTVSVDDFYYGSNTTGVDLSGGDLTLTNGQVLRGTTGITKTGGTITLDGNQPVNVPDTGTIGAPATRQTGLDAGEVATLVGVAAV